MNEILLSFLLGLIQGLTEFLPISSSAHILFPTLLFGTDDLGLAFDIAVHAGTLCAVIYFFRSEIFQMSKSLFAKSNELKDNRKLAYLLVIATFPIVIAGLFGSDFIELNRNSISSIAYMNLLFAGLLLLAYKYNSSSKTLVELTVAGAIFIGMFQVFALLPGASRSGTALTAALMIGINIKDSSKFAFLLAIPTIFGALFFLVGDMAVYQTQINVTSLIIGFLTSSIVAFLTIKYFLVFVEKIGMYPFVIYRLILGVFILVLI
jgi:undecaprenyl-diphosphatase